MFGFLLRRLFSITALCVAIFLLIGIPLLMEGLSQTSSGSKGLAVAGGLLVASAVGFGGWRGWKACQAAWVVGYGRRTEATVTTVEIDHSMKINERHPRFLRYVFQLPSSGQKIEGEGPYLSAKEESRWRSGMTVRIAYHPEDPRVSVVLPEQAQPDSDTRQER